VTLDFLTLNTVDILTLSASAVALLFSLIALIYTRRSTRAAEKAADATVAAANAAERQAAAAERAEIGSSGQAQAQKQRHQRQFETLATSIARSVRAAQRTLKDNRVDQIFTSPIITQRSWEDFTKSAAAADVVLDLEDLGHVVRLPPSLFDAQTKFRIEDREADLNRFDRIAAKVMGGVASMYTVYGS
jgi:hypothetical protein